MDLTPQQLEELVVRVVGEILTSSAGASASEAPGQPGKFVASYDAAPAAKQVAIAAPEKPADIAVMIEQSVITGDLLRERINGKKQVHIASRAVLTPSARDFLRNSNIVCVRGEQVAKAAVVSGRWLVIISSSSPAIDGAINAQRDSTETWEQKISGTAEEAAKLAVGAICRGEATGVVVISKAPEVVACLSNRNEQIRAAVVGCVRTVEAAQRKIGANVIAIHPGTKGSFELRNMFKAFAASIPGPPAGW